MYHFVACTSLPVHVGQKFMNKKRNKTMNENNDKYLVLFHDDADGYAAAAVVMEYLNRHHPEAEQEYQPVQYKQPAPDVSGYKTVFIVDFSYSRETMIALDVVTPVVCFDHHKTAEAALEGDRKSVV